MGKGAKLLRSENSPAAVLAAGSWNGAGTGGTPAGPGLERSDFPLPRSHAARSPCTLAGIWPEGWFSGIVSVGT